MPAPTESPTTNQPSALHRVLAAFRDDARSNRDLGDRFERLMQRYFELDPIYSERFAKISMWQDWPRRGSFGDTGIDLVAEERGTGNCVAIQCKFHDPDHPVTKEDLDSFFNAVGKDAFSSGIIVATAEFSRNAEDTLQNRVQSFKPD